MSKVPHAGFVFIVTVTRRLAFASLCLQRFLSVRMYLVPRFVTQLQRMKNNMSTYSHTKVIAIEFYENTSGSQPKK